MKQRGCEEGEYYILSFPQDISDLYAFLENVKKPELMKYPVGGGYFSVFITYVILCNP